MNYWRQDSHVPVLGAEGKKTEKSKAKKANCHLAPFRSVKDGIKDFFK